MSEAPLPNDGMSDAELVDFTIQRKWDQFAMLDPSVDPASPDAPLVPTSPSSTNPVDATTTLNSHPVYATTAALGDALARAQRIGVDFSGGEVVAPGNRGAI